MVREPPCVISNLLLDLFSVEPPCESSPCIHGGTCVNTDLDEYQCLCTVEYIGLRCEIGKFKGQIIIEKSGAKYVKR